MNLKNYDTKHTISSDKLWKDRLNNNGQQFHQYQQNEWPPLTSRININVIHMLKVIYVNFILFLDLPGKS